MTVEYTGEGDPQRTLELLWGTRERAARGPRPKLTAEAIIRAGIEIADADGLTVLSMRRVADRLDVGAMSLYTYVPGKAELIDAMLDRVSAQTARPPIGPDRRAALTAIAWENWDLHRRHPWTLYLGVGRPALGPNLLDKYEYEISALDGIGLDDVTMDSVLALVLGHTQVAARGHLDAAQTVARTGLTDQQWWDATAPLLAEVVPVGHYPVSGRVGNAVGERFGSAGSAEHLFEFGLAVILDGIPALRS